jgi:predicted RNase H-like HicB family nuclease
LSQLHYAVVIEREGTSYGAYVPDLPGCVAVADTESEVRRLIREAIALHIQAMQEDGDPIPEPTTQVEYVPLAS